MSADVVEACAVLDATGGLRRILIGLSTLSLREMWRKLNEDLGAKLVILPDVGGLECLFEGLTSLAFG